MIIWCTACFHEFHFINSIDMVTSVILIYNTIYNNKLIYLQLDNDLAYLLKLILKFIKQNCCLTEFWIVEKGFGRFLLSSRTI